eukprot:s1720_g13.t1
MSGDAMAEDLLDLDAVDPVVQAGNTEAVLELRVPYQHMQQGVYCIEEVQHARRFVEQLRKGLDITLANRIEEVVGKSVASVLHLQRSLPARIQSLLEDVQQARDVEGKRVVEVIERSGVREEDIKFCQDAISQIQEHIFGRKLENLLQMVKECEAEFTKTQGGYHQCMREQELHLYLRHIFAKVLKFFYKPLLEITKLPPDLFLFGSFIIATLLKPKGARLNQFQKLLLPPFLAALGKTYFLGLRTDFDTIQKNSEAHMSEVRRIKCMGQQIGSHLKTVNEDIQILQGFRARFEQLKKQIPHYQARCLDATCWDAEMLYKVLNDFDMGEAAVVLLNNKIPGRAFLEVMSKEDLENLGITDPLTLRRLLDLQASGAGKERNESCHREARI